MKDQELSETSTKNLMWRCYWFSLEIGYERVDGKVSRVRDNEELLGEELFLTVWGWCDGLHFEHIDNIVSGRCSLRAILNFDPAEYDTYLMDTISRFENAILKHGYATQDILDEIKADAEKPE